MFRNVLVATALMSFTLFATPSMGLTDNQSIQPEGQTVEVASDGQARKGEPRSIASKRARITESAESVDCFYDANSANPDCAVAKPGQP